MKHCLYYCSFVLFAPAHVGTPIEIRSAAARKTYERHCIIFVTVELLTI